MSEQLTLVDVPAAPTLTSRQQRALDLITRSGHQGLESDELGAHFHRHPADQRCRFCATTGRELGRRLRADGLVQQRRRQRPAGDPYTVWTVAGKLDQPEQAGPKPGSVPYNTFPAGF